MSAVQPFVPGADAVKINPQEAARQKRTAQTRRRVARLAPKPGDVLLFYGPERGRSRLICWFTRSRFYHVGIYAGDGKVIEARIPSVICRDLYDSDGCRFVVIRAPENTGNAVLDWARERIGHAYDTRGVIQLGLRRLFPFLPFGPRPDNAFVCGSFVARAFAHAGVDLFAGRDRDHIAPCDFAALLPRYA